MLKLPGVKSFCQVSWLGTYAAKNFPEGNGGDEDPTKMPSDGVNLLNGLLDLRFSFSTKNQGAQDELVLLRLILS